MAGKQVATFGGIAAVGAGAYYLYSAGGDPKLAEKKMEHDAATAARKARGQMPGAQHEAKKAGEEGYETVRATAQQYAEKAKSQAKDAEVKLDAYSADARKKYEDAKVEAARDFQQGKHEFNAAVDKFDQKVLQDAAKTKSWFGSWFGGK
ncbi:hypothetical protein P153DRAFT_425690 [Dothidotthia symphoricarpi CBS 119687]|uniref:Uncharacterized protein n=1 Tax=Dothidotthia symphoricarpi CBS 119687 TaxID=1392245 RepID=A0A6A6A1Q6_9PLEO|nr:uncharacterized protein P153DRAFT_425690 [Dothidotthia symphoricarpi CBS 119687]KAF2125932.1 hypothetical protein P153DRAFT_425690 [Dothidotthia symphoricarpi CBS 119687]